MGLHTGEVIAEEGDFFGKNVILAARIAAQADGGEILVSERMRDAAEDHGSEGPEGTDLRFDEGRELELKGLAGTHRVYRAEWERPSGGHGGTRRRLAAAVSCRRPCFRLSSPAP